MASQSASAPHQPVCETFYPYLHPTPAEGTDAPRMMSIGLHLRIMGRPGRIGGLEAFLAHAAAKPGVWFARRDEIAHAWRAGIGLPRWQPTAPLSEFVMPA